MKDDPNENYKGCIVTPFAIYHHHKYVDMGLKKKRHFVHLSLRMYMDSLLLFLIPFTMRETARE